MVKRVPPQLRATLLGSVLQKGHGRLSAAPSPDCVSRCFASAVNAGESCPLPVSRPSVYARGPTFSFSTTRKNDRCCGVFPAAAFSSSSSCDSSHIVAMKSAEEFENALKKVQDDALPAVFYFSAAWCGPCKILAPVVNELSRTYAPCVTYKVDIDMEGIQNKLEELAISAVPTLYFYKDGKMSASVVGADVNKIKEIMNQLYK